MKERGWLNYTAVRIGEGTETQATFEGDPSRIKGGGS